MAVQAQAEAPNVQPRFEVEHVEETVTHRAYRYVTKTIGEGDKSRKVNVREEYDKEEPFGYMAYFPHGHSLRISSMQELVRLGLHRQPGLVDMDTGDVIAEDQEPMSLKERSQRHTQPPRRAGKRLG